MDILEFLENELKIEGKLSPSGWYRACCPIHGERSPSFAVYTEYPYHFKCFSCEKAGQLPYLTSLVLKMPLGAARDFVQDRVKIMVDYNRLFREKNRREFAVPDAVVQAYRQALPGSRTMSYCSERGIPKFVLDSFCIGHDQMNLQMMIPLLSVLDSRIMGFDTRGFFSRSEPPEKSTIVPEGFKDGVVVGPARYRKRTKVIVVEGFFDAAKTLMWLMQTGREDYAPVSFGGVSISDKQLKLLSRFDRIVLGYDNDVAGNKAVGSVAKRLSNIPLYRLCFDGKDPGEAALKSFNIRLLL